MHPQSLRTLPNKMGSLVRHISSADPAWRLATPNSSLLQAPGAGRSICIRALAKLSSALHRLATTVFKPAARKASAKSLTPSSPCSLPTPVSHAESVVRSAFNRNFLISRTCNKPSSPAFGSVPRTNADRSGYSASANPCTAKCRMRNWLSGSFLNALSVALAPNRVSAPFPQFY